MITILSCNFKIPRTLLYIIQSNLLEELSHLELVALLGQLGLDLRVGVVDDGEEHVEEDEEDKEDVDDEEGRTEDAVRLDVVGEGKVAENDAEQREAVEKK